MLRSKLPLAYCLVAALLAPARSIADDAADLTAALNEAKKLEAAGKLKEAERYREQTVQLSVKINGENHPRTAGLLHNYALLLQNQGKYAAAEPLYRRSLAIKEKVLGPNDTNLALTVENLANLYKSQGKYANAEPLLQRNLAIVETARGKEHLEVAQACEGLGTVYCLMAKYDAAEPLFRRCLAIREKALGNEHPLVMDSLHSLALLDQDLGKFRDAEALFQRALAIGEKALGADHARLARLLTNYASLCVAVGKYAEAEKLAERGLGIAEQAFGSVHPRVAASLTYLGILYQSQGKFAESERALLRSLNIFEKINGPENPDAAAALGNLAVLYEAQKKFAAAEPLYQRVLAIHEKFYGKNHPSVAATLENLGNLQFRQGKFAQAEEFYQRSLAIIENANGKEHVDIAGLLSSLASVYVRQRKFAEAEKLYQRGLAIQERALGKAHPSVSDSLNNLFVMYCEEKKHSEAAQAQTRYRRSTREFLLRELPRMSPREQQDFLELKVRMRFSLALSVGRSQAADPSFAEASASWLVNGKAVALEAQTIRQRLDREITNPDDQAILHEIQILCSQESTLALKGKQPEDAAKQHEQLETRRRGLEKKLAPRSNTAAKLANPWIELADVRKTIGANQLLIDIVRLPIYRFGTKTDLGAWTPAHYVAWLIPAAGAGNVRIVDLGDAATIDAAIQAARQSLEGTPDRLEKRESERKLEADVAEKLSTVAKLVFEPLKPHLGKAKQLILSPDGDLWLLPWAALPTGKDRYLIEDYSLRFVVTGRDQIDYAVDKKPATTAALILADPDYNLTPGQVAAAAPKQSSPSIPEGTLLAQTRGISDELRGVGRVKRLPGTVAEAKQAFDKLKKLTGQEPKLFMEAQASETIVKATKSPRVLVLATHGYFLKNQEVELAGDELVAGGEKKLVIVKDKEGKELENPLLRCGLLLAGANKRAQAKDGEDDGILTGLEIVGLDLRGTQMVVLSACETGVGVVQTGEGVAGLRQAFQLAGAESVLATLWQISDSATSRLMNTFYDELAKGTERSEALALAQRQFVKERRDKSGSAHPYFWASFTLTGK